MLDVRRAGLQVMPGYYLPEYIEGWTMPEDHPLPPSARRKLD